jgi:hypothetical protein
MSWILAPIYLIVESVRSIYKALIALPRVVSTVAAGLSALFVGAIVAMQHGLAMLIKTNPAVKGIAESIQAAGAGGVGASIPDNPVLSVCGPIIYTLAVDILFAALTVLIELQFAVWIYRLVKSWCPTVSS